MSAGHVSRQFRLGYGEPPHGELMTQRIERAMALLRRGNLSVTEVCFAVGCSSLGAFRIGFTELSGCRPAPTGAMRWAPRPGCRRVWRSR
jgi:methylphosphotriester-DNA--protein-cysteine methyltransferase